MTFLDRTGVRVGAASFALFTVLAGEGPRNLLGWWGWGVFAVASIAIGVALLVHARARLSVQTLPIPLILFLVVAALSIAWSNYPASSTLGVALTLLTTAVGAGIALALEWKEILRALGWALRAILGLSFLFELVVSLVIRHPVYPVWLNPQDYVNPDAKLLLWSRNLLLDGGKIQGIVGNSSLLAMIALLAAIVFSIQLASGSVGQVQTTLWLASAALAIGLTRSATILVALAAVVIVAAAAVLVRRSSTMRRRSLVRGTIAVGVLAAAAAALAFQGSILRLLGKSSDFTGRFDIWEAVIGLAEQRPVAGWGWLGFWMPWTEPLNHLIVKGGVQVLHAHNAWLDVWLQLGFIGLAVFAALILSTAVRSWALATDRTITTPGATGTVTWVALLPLLVLTAQLVQSVAESRMLIEGGWVLLVIAAIGTKRSNQVLAD